MVSSDILDATSNIPDDIIIIDKETMAIPEIRKAVLDILGEADNEIV